MEKKSLNRAKAKDLLLNYNSVLILVLLLLVGTFLVDRFNRNFYSILVDCGLYGFVAAGLFLIMVTGNIDLSVGWILGVSSVITILVLNVTGSLLLAILAALLCGLLMGAINGFAVVKLGINPLIATIATCYIYKGFDYYFTKDGAIYPATDALKDSLKNSMARCQLFDLKFLTLTFVIFLATAAVIFFFMRKSRFGVSQYIAGDNAEAGRLAGININRTVFLSYALCGLMCAMSGLFFASNAGGAIYTQGEGREVFAISACVIGGIKMAGGKGTVLNLLLGILIMRIISLFMNLLLVPSSVMDMVSGGLLLVVLVIDRFTSKKEKS